MLSKLWRDMCSAVNAAYAARPQPPPGAPAGATLGDPAQLKRLGRLMNLLEEVVEGVKDEEEFLF